MTKQEIIALTLQQIEYRKNPPPEEIADCVGIEGYDDFVIAELNEQLPRARSRPVKTSNTSTSNAARPATGIIPTTT